VCNLLESLPPSGFDKTRLALGRLNLDDHGGALGLAPTGKDDLRALPAKCERGGFADVGDFLGDEGDFVVKGLKGVDWP
jgi:hypothetical protein